MASPQIENGYTRIANELLDALAKIELPGAQFRLALAIMRKTYGYNKKEDSISIQQFVDMLGMSKRAIIYNLQDLEAKGIVMIRRSRNGDKNNVNVIRFNKDYETWVVHISAPQVEANRGSAKLRKQGGGGSAKLGTGVVQNSVKGSANSLHPQKTIQKKTKDISKTCVLQGTQWQSLIDAFAPINPMYTEFYSNKTERKALEQLTEKYGYDKLLATVQSLPQIVSRPYAPKITKPSALKRDLGKLLIYIQQEKINITNKTNAIAEI